MYVHLDTVLNTVLRNNCETILFTFSYGSLDPESVNLHMKDTNQDIQDATSDYCVSTYTPDGNILDTSDDTIKYIDSFI